MRGLQPRIFILLPPLLLSREQKDEECDARDDHLC